MRATGGRRLVELDELRGLALVWMVFIHGLLANGWVAPQGLGWAVFVLVGGSLWRGRMGRRYIEVLLSAVAAYWLITRWALPLNGFNVLMAWAVVTPLWRAARALRLAPGWQTVAAVGLVWYWPLGGSNPGVLWLVALLGYNLGPDAVASMWSRIPWAGEWRLLAWVGRHPLTVYVGHLGLMAIAMNWRTAWALERLLLA